MRLRIETRLPHDLMDLSAEEPVEMQRNRAVYRITEVISETPWAGLYRGKKVFHNFDFKDRRINEVEDHECLDVFVKTICYPVLDQRPYVTARRELAAFEARKVLGCRKTNLIPEPLGYLEVRNDEDIFTFPRAGQLSTLEPILISEAIHGESLARWRQRQQQPDLLIVLRVLAEMLELMETLHQEQMLLNNIGPAAFWIDTAHRVHFVGTENVVHQAHSQTIRSVFPPQRYSRGFTAPELSHPEVAPSTESDLFGWAAMAYFLITGDSPSRLAAEQQQSWARFSSPQREVLRDSLLVLTSTQTADIQHWLGIEGTRFAARWPDSFVDGVLNCLDPDPRQRVRDVAGLRGLWGNAPPPRVSRALAVLRPDGRVQLRFSAAGMSSALTFLVRRQWGQAPRSVNDGIEIWKGSVPSKIEDIPPKPKNAMKEDGSNRGWQYSVFSQDLTDGNVARSAACPFVMLDGSIPQFGRRFAEEFATAPSVAGQVIPAPLVELDLLAAIETLPVLVEQLLSSRDTLVRSWAVRLIDQRLQRVPTDQACIDVLLQSGLKDPVYQLRRDSATILVKYSADCGVEFVVKILAPALGGANLDERIRAVRGMREIGLSRDLIDTAIRTFELDRPVACSVCHENYRAGDIDEHLIQSHGFVPLDGQVLPLGEALKRLWVGLFQGLDPAAFRDLVSLLEAKHGDRTAAALCASFRLKFISLQENPETHRTPSQLAEYLARLVHCLQASPLGEELCCHLLVDENPTLNQLGRQFFIRRAAQELAADDATVASFRQWIEFLVPHETSPIRIQICEQLVALGANTGIAETIRQELELNRFVLCPECGDSLQVRTLGRHRRMVHQIFEFESQRYTLVSLFTELANRLVSPESNLFTAMTLLELHEEQFGDAALAKLSELLFKKLRLLEDTELRNRVLIGASSSLAPLRVAPRWCHQLLRSDLLELNELGLMLFGHLTKCSDTDLARRAAAFVGNTSISEVARSQATVALVRWSRNWPDVCRKGLIAYANGISADPLERYDALQALQERTGESALVQEACREQTENRRIRCPKCEQVLLGKEMPEHALTQHQRIFDGRSLRRPWSVALETLENYATHPDPVVLKKGEQLSQVEFPEDGLVRFAREALRRGIEPGHYRQTLEHADSGTNVSICPSCFELVSKPLAAIASVACPDENELTSDSICISRNVDSWISIHSEIQGVGEFNWTGRQPGWTITRRGLLVAILASTWIPAAGLLFWFGAGRPAVSMLVQGAFLLGGIASVAVAQFYRPRDAHVLDTAWNIVIPHWIQTDNIDPARQFIAGLCAASVGRGNRLLRMPHLLELNNHFEQLATRGHISESCLGAIGRLRLYDALDRGGSSIEILELVTPLVRGALSGERPLSILNFATTDGAYFNLLPEATVVAIRWRVLQIALSLEWSFPDVFVAAKTCPALRALICPSVGSIREKLADAWALLELRPQQIPVNCQTVMQLIQAGSCRPLEQDPDLLCHANERDIRVCSRGVIVAGTCYAIMPSVSVKVLERFVQTGWTYERKDGGPDQRYKQNPAKGYQKRIGYEFRLNGTVATWRTDPTEYANQIRKMAALLFEQIRSRSEQLEKQKPTFRVEQIFRPRIATCLNCGQLLIHTEDRFATAISK